MGTVRNSTALLLAVYSACAAVAGSPAEAVAAAAADLPRVPAGLRPYTRYLALTDQEGPGQPAGTTAGKAKKQLWQLISAHVNGASLKRRISRPWVILVGEGNTLTEADGLRVPEKDWDRAILLRIYLTDYGWLKETWELLANVDPDFRFLQPDTTGKFSTVKVQGPAVVAPAPIVGPAPDERVWVHRQGRMWQVKRSQVGVGEKCWLWEAGAWKPAPAPAPPLTIRVDGKEVYPRRQEPAKKEERKVLSAPWVPQKERAELEKETGTAVPVVLASFFWWQTSIQAEREPGPGYYDLLQIKNERDFQLRGGFDAAAFKKQFAEFVREYREAVARSGVARQPRRVASFKTLGGYGFVTFDSKKALGAKNPLDTPNDAFDFEASEELFNGANGILIQGLFAKGGTRQDSAPDFVGPDKSSTDNDGRIHAGQCFRCHAEGLKTFRGYYKNIYRGRVSVEGPDGKEISKLQDEYFERIEDSIDKGRELHAEAIRKACGLKLAEYSQAITEVWKAYNSDGFTLVKAAMRLGTTPVKLTAAVRGLKARRPDQSAPLAGIRVYDLWLLDEKDQEPIPVDQFHDCVGELHLILMGAKP